MLFTLASCQINNINTGIIITGSNISSPSFLKAKYLTELSYITKDKKFVSQFKECYIKRECTDPKFKTLRKWSAGKNRDLVVESINLFLKADFQGI